MTRMTWNEERIPLLCKADHDHYPQVVRWTRAASGTTGWKRRSPLLGKGGVAAPSSKWSRSFGGAARSVSPVGRNIKNGVVRSTSDNRWLEPTTPSAPAKGLRGIFLMGAATPPCPRRGLRLSLQLFSMPPCPAKDVGHGKGASPGYRNQQTLSPEGAKDSAATLSPLPGLGSTLTRAPGLRPGLRSYAAPRQKPPDPHCASFFQGV